DTPWSTVGPHLARILLVLVACLAVVPLNPSVAQLYRYPLDVVRSPGMRSFIVEWLPPDFHQLRFLPIFLIWVALLFALASPRFRLRMRWVVPLFLSWFAALDAIRHIAILVLLATPVIADGLSSLTLGVAISDMRPPRLPAFRSAFR